MMSALRNPHVDIIGHPTGILLGERAPADMDFGLIVRESVAQGVALEINANPARLDLDDVHARQVRNAGGWLCINTDAHRRRYAGGHGFRRRHGPAWLVRARRRSQHPAAG